MKTQPIIYKEIKFPELVMGEIGTMSLQIQEEKQAYTMLWKSSFSKNIKYRFFLQQLRKLVAGADTGYLQMYYKILTLISEEKEGRIFLLMRQNGIRSDFYFLNEVPQEGKQSEPFAQIIIADLDQEN